MVETSPNPVTLMTCGLAGESSEIVMVPVSVPAASGEKVMFSVQKAFTVILVPQSSFSPKLALGVIPERLRVVFPTFFNITGWAELVVCSSCVRNVKELADNCARPLAFTVKLPATSSEPLETVTVCDPVVAFIPIVNIAFS